MSASQQAQNKKLHKIIDQLEAQIDRLNCENDNIKGLTREAFFAGMEEVTKGEVYWLTENDPFVKWARQKGLT